MKKGILVILIFVGLCYVGGYLSSEKEVFITIKNKERITQGSGEDISSKYLVYTTNEVFENTDTLLFTKWDSSDLQNNLNDGNTYKVKVAGWRIPFFSMYRNIIEIKEEIKEGHHPDGYALEKL